MMTIEKTDTGIQLGLWLGDHWEWNLFKSTDELEIYCHENGYYCE